MRKAAQVKRAALLRKRRNKYGVAPKDERTRGLEVFDSKLEMRYSEQLDLLRHALHPRDRVESVRRQVAIPLEVNGCLICHYRADFEVMYGDGRIELHEVKGLDTPEWRLKEKLFRALFPALTLKVIRKV